MPATARCRPHGCRRRYQSSISVRAIEIGGDTLQVRGEKRFERESTEGRWRVLQCAYGSFQRSVPLPAPVRGEEASASYRDGVLRIDLPKREPGRPGSVHVKVD